MTEKATEASRSTESQYAVGSQVDRGVRPHVTVEHGKQGHSASRIAEIIQQALEQGVEGFAAFPAAQVDAFKGNMIGGGGINIEHERYARIIPLHDAVHA